MAGYFSIFLVILTFVSGILWLLDIMIWAPKRKEALAKALENTNNKLKPEDQEKITQQPPVIEMAESIFPVIAFVLVLRSFLYEPFQIPSGSMKPTLLDGDFILVEKFTYGLKDPVARSKFVDIGDPERGDVIVFKYPLDTSIDFIKRVVGVPGDRVIYRDKTLYIKKKCEEGMDKCPKLELVEQSEKTRGEFYYGAFPLIKATEKLGETEHEILINPSRFSHTDMFYQQESTQIDEWIVPQGHYFVMGDNRDNSKDSRFWGFVPEENLVGKAVAIWMSFEFDRPEDSFLPGWIPTDIRFRRIGGIR